MSYSNGFTLIALCLSASIGLGSQSRAANADSAADSADSSNSSAVSSAAAVVTASANAATGTSSAPGTSSSASTAGSLSEVVVVATRLNAERSEIETKPGAGDTTT